jgi:hypothetical protein
MHWLRRIFAPRNRPFLIYVAVLLALLVGARWYKGSFGRRQLRQIAVSARRAVADKAELPKMKMERSTLEFQLLNLPQKYPVLTNAPLTRDWSAAANLSQLDPALCQTWRAYLERVSPLVVQGDPDLQIFATLQQGFENEVEKLARDPFIPNKPQRLLNLQSNTFAALFREPKYVADGARFAEAARKIKDEQTESAREAYETELADTVAHLNPKLAGYSRARHDLAAQSDAIRQRLAQLSEQLADLGELPAVAETRTESSPAPIARQHSSGLELLQTYMPTVRDFLLVEMGTAAIAFVITLPVELRQRRWLKILASVALVHLGMLAMRVPFSSTESVQAERLFSFFGYLLPAVFLAALWTSDLTFTFSKAFLQLIDPGGPAETEVSSLRPAYRAARQGELRLALSLLKPKLLAEPANYEALLLKARLHRQLNQPWRAKRTLRRILGLPHLVEAQHQQADHLLGHLSDAAQAGWQLETARPVQTPLAEQEEQIEESAAGPW